MSKVQKKAGKVVPIISQDYLSTLLSLLSKARKSIDVLSYSFAIGSSGGKHNVKTSPYEIVLKLRSMKEKCGDRIKIRFYTEGFRETYHRNKVTADFLSEAGIEVKYGATHAKGFCIDGRYVLFGSTNLTHQSITKNHEANLLIDDKKMAKGFLHYFEHLWLGGKHGEVELEAPWLADGSFKDALVEMVDHSKKRIDFSIYFFNHREIEKALIRAHERGVKITGFIHQHRSFALSYIYRNRSTVKRMREAGMAHLYFSVPNTFSHSKYLVADGKEILLGTGNWLEEDVKIHPQLAIHLKDAALAKALIKHVVFQIKDHSTDD